jgi:hypothetical protein
VRSHAARYRTEIKPNFACNRCCCRSAHLHFLRKAGPMPHRGRRRTARARRQEQGLSLRVSPLYLALLLVPCPTRSLSHSFPVPLVPCPTRPFRYAWGVMAWQPSAWPLLNDQDPHTGYMMQVRRTRCAALPQDFSTFSAAFLYIFSCISLHFQRHTVAGRTESRSPGRLRCLRVPLL